MKDTTSPMSEDPLARFLDPHLGLLPELSDQLAEQFRLIEQMARLLELYLQQPDPDRVGQLQSLERDGVALRQRNLLSIKSAVAIPVSRDSLCQASLFAESVQGSLAGIAADLEGVNRGHDWHVLEMAGQVCLAVQRLRVGYEKWIETPSRVDEEVQAVFQLRKAMEKSYRVALARLLNSTDGEHDTQENVQRLFRIFRQRELYRRFRELFIEIANCGRLLQEMALQFA